MKTIAMVLILGCATAALAQDAANARNWESICKDVTAQPLVEPRLTGPLSATKLPECNTGALYYGIFGSKHDHEAALQCGWYQRAHPESGNLSGDIDHGVGTLMMLYANGFGVARDYDMAIRFACEYSWGQKSDRLEHLDALKNGPQGRTAPFDVCDDMTGKSAMGSCEVIKQTLNDLEHEKTFAGITARLTVAQKRLFDKLRAAEDNFEGVRTDKEVDWTFGVLWAEQDRGRLSAQFLNDLERFAKSDATPATASDVVKLDAQMNAAYQKAVQAPLSFYVGTVKPEGIRETQSAWLQMRDAWMEFAKAAYPRLAPERVMAQLIRLRLNQLKSLPIVGLQ